jgi:hypothetical protein
MLIELSTVQEYIVPVGMIDPLGKFKTPLKESPEQRSMGEVISAIVGWGLISMVIGTALLTHWFVVVVML